MNEAKRNWWSVYPTWIKYCGVCDEYASLKSKWKYLSSIKGLSALPMLDETFKRIDYMIEETNEKFRPMFDRQQLDSIDTFNSDHAEIRMNDLQERFYSLTHYLGILKFIFFQRTVSFEIPEVVSGMPLSPERTIGNEAIYLAADNVTQRYLNCINIDPNLRWDGAISFIYPVQQDHFFGGYSRPDRYLNHIHVLLSEENKHFLGSYLILAHEISHAVHFKTKGNEIGYPNWLNEMWRKVAGEQVRRFADNVTELEDKCQECYVSRYLATLLGDLSFNSEELQQFIADLIALLIGGPTTCFALIDMFLNSGEKERYFPLRPAFLHGYCLQSGLELYRFILEREILKMKEGWDKYLPIFAPRCPDTGLNLTTCYALLMNIGEHSGRVFAYYNSRLLRDLRTELPTESVTYPPGVDSLISALVKDKFDIAPDTQERICHNLQARRVCPTEDPRHILHCYYTLYREEQPPDYAATLCSLAYNTFLKK